MKRLILICLAVCVLSGCGIVSGKVFQYKGPQYNIFGIREDGPGPKHEVHKNYPPVDVGMPK